MLFKWASKAENLLFPWLPLCSYWPGGLWPIELAVVYYLWSCMEISIVPPLGRGICYCWYPCIIWPRYGSCMRTSDMCGLFIGWLCHFCYCCCWSLSWRLTVLSIIYCKFLTLPCLKSPLTATSYGKNWGSCSIFIFSIPACWSAPSNCYSSSLNYKYSAILLSSEGSNSLNTSQVLKILTNLAILCLPSGVLSAWFLRWFWITRCMIMRILPPKICR